MKLIYFMVVAFICSCNSEQKTATEWCNPPGREVYNNLTEVVTPGNWFKTYQIADSVYAITEPYNFEQEISYLILGSDKALLFDTGLGIDSISKTVKHLTNLPVTVINSHTHYDHTGSNHEFDNILALRTGFTEKNANEGWSHDAVKHEVAADAICQKQVPGFNPETYRIKPFKIASFVEDGHTIDLGGKTIQVISIPGHTPDAIALYDEKNGYLWTGDTFYEDQIYLFANETDLFAYEKSIAKLALLVPKVKKLFASHNNPVSDPERLNDLNDALAKVKSRSVKGEPQDDNALVFHFKYFDLLINKNKLDNFKN